MRITDTENLSVRRHAMAVMPAIGLRDGEYRQHQRSWKQLNDDQAAIMKAAQANNDGIKDGLSERELATREECHEALMSIHDAIGKEKDLRTKIGSKEARSEEDPPRHLDRRPLPRDTDGDDEDDNFGSDQPETLYALRSDQSFARFIEQRDSRRSRGEPQNEYRGLTEGSFIRAMVTGPRNDIEKRALNEGTDSAGGYTVPNILSARMIDRMRAKLVIGKSGAQTVPLTADNLTIAKVLSDPVPAWRAEAGQVAESDPTFGAVQLIPKSIAVLVKVSRELLEDSINIETMLPEIMAAAIALEIDRVALVGTGTDPQPRGVKNFAGLTAPVAATDIAANDYSEMVKVRTKLRTANSDVTAYIMHPGIEGGLAAAVDGNGNPLQKPPAIENIPMLTTTAIPTNLGAGSDETIVFAGDWKRLMIGIRNEIRIEVLKERYADTLQYGFIAHARIAVAAEDEKAFAVVTGFKV